MLLTTRSLWEVQLTHYTLTADAGSFALSGNDAGLRATRSLTAAVGAFTLTGNDTGLTSLPAPTERNYILGGLFPTYVQETGTRDFVLVAAYVEGTFPDALNAYSLPTTTGAFTLTGNATGLLRGYPLAAGLGAFVLTGTASGLTAARKLVAGTGTFSLTGQDAALTAGATVAVDVGVFALTGIDAGLRADRKITSDVGSFSLTGNAAGLFKSYPLAAETGAFALTGQAVGFSVDRTLTGQVGAFSLVGNDADLVYQPNVTTREYVLGGLFPVYVQETNDRDYVVSAVFLSETMGQPVAYSLSVDAGAFVLTGNDAAFVRSYVLTAETGQFALVGNAAGLTHLVIGPTITFGGAPARRVFHYRLEAGTGTFSVAANDAGLYVGRYLNAEAAKFKLTVPGHRLRAQSAAFRIDGSPVRFERQLFSDEELLMAFAEAA